MLSERLGTSAKGRGRVKTEWGVNGHVSARV